MVISLIALPHETYHLSTLKIDVFNLYFGLPSLTLERFTKQSVYEQQELS